MKLDYQLWENYIDVSIKTISKGHLTLLPSRRISPKNLLFLSHLRWFAPISRELKCVDVLGSKVFWRGGGGELVEFSGRARTGPSTAIASDMEIALQL